MDERWELKQKKFVIGKKGLFENMLKTQLSVVFIIVYLLYPILKR